MRKLLILLAVVALLAPFASAQEYSITLDPPTGVSAQGTIDIGSTVLFPLRWNIDGAAAANLPVSPTASTFIPRLAMLSGLI